MKRSVQITLLVSSEEEEERNRFITKCLRSRVLLHRKNIMIILCKLDKTSWTQCKKYVNLQGLGPIHVRILFNPLTYGQIYLHWRLWFLIYKKPTNIFFKSVLRVLCLKKALKFDLFQKCQKPKSSFLNILQKFLQKWTSITLFTLFWYPTLLIWNFHFSTFWL